MNIMEKEKIHLEYLLNATSKTILWSAISTPTGLEGWFAELKMTNNELTNDFVLEITDFAHADEVDDACGLWESQVETLRRTCGF